MVTDIATVQFKEFTEFKDVVLRVFTPRGSSPVVIVSEGKIRSAEDIGEQMLGLFEYHVESPVFNEAKEA